MTTLTLHGIRTRDEYVRERLVSHDDYYAQFVTPETLRHVGWAFDTDTLRSALQADEHLNTIPIQRWDLLAVNELDGRNRGSLRSSGPFTAAIPFDRRAASAAGEMVSRSTLVCIAKRAAKMLVERSCASAPNPLKGADMFTPITDHPATTGAGRIGGYVPQGASPFAPAPHTCNQDGVCLIHAGDPVRVESAWDRGDGFVLLYARSVVTQQATHIPEADYLAIDRIIVGSPGQPAAWAPRRRTRCNDDRSEIRHG